MIRAAINNTVTVKYTGRLADGTVFDESPEATPLTFIVGRKEVIAGFDHAVLDMSQGERKTVVIKPDQAYGESNPALIQKVNRADLPQDLQLIEGAQLEVTRDDGSILLLLVAGITETEVTLDANHPLAGKSLTFDIEMLDINTDPPKEIPPIFSGAMESIGEALRQ